MADGIGLVLFVPSDSFISKREGYFFGRGKLGVGYYLDSPPSPPQKAESKPVRTNSKRSYWKFAIVAAVFAISVLFFRSKSHHSVIILALTYLSRPHSNRDKNHIYQPIIHPNAWNGTYMAQNPDIWTYNLTEDDKSAFDNAVRHFENLNLPLYQLTTDTFPLPKGVIKKIESWKFELSEEGRGFQLIKGVPVLQNNWTMKQCEIFFFALGKYLGIPGAQDQQGTLLGHVADIGASNKTERPYRQKVDISFHCDGSDYVGLLCIHPAKSGGASRIISSVTMYNELLKHPDGQAFVSRLFGRVLSYTRKSFGLASYLAVSPLRMDSNGVLRTFWNQEFYQKSYVHPNGTLTEWGERDPLVTEAIKAYDSILNEDYEKGKRKIDCAIGKEKTNCDFSNKRETEFGLDMMLEQGDIQLVSNHYVLHARTEFEDYTDLEIETSSNKNSKNSVNNIGRRELLRLWVSDKNEKMSWKLYLDKQLDFVRVIASFAEAIIYYQ